jgi:protein O-GlcNAc transferase
LHAIGLPELVTHSLADYETLVLQLINDAPRLASLKARLLANKKTHPLFDTDGFCRDLEALYLSLRPAKLAEQSQACSELQAA